MSLRARAGVQDPVDASPSANTSGRVDYSNRRLRLPYHFVEPTVIVGDIVIVIACSLISGFAYNYASAGNVPAMQVYAAIGVLASLNLSAILAARGDYRVIKLLGFHRQATGIDAHVERRIARADQCGLRTENSRGFFARRHVYILFSRTWQFDFAGDALSRNSSVTRFRRVPSPRAMSS